MKLEISGQGLMQDAGLEPAGSEKTKDWYNSGKSSFRHHSEYLRRLTKLREDLIRDERKGLSKAVARLGQLPEADSQGLYVRNREGRDQRKVLPRLPNHHIFVQKVLTSTAERFRLMKPPQSLPKLVPLEGKQVFDKIEKRESPKQNKNASNHVTFERSSSYDLCADDGIKIDLKKYLKPSCSIPSIGPRALRHEGISLAIDNFVVDEDRSNQSQYALFLGKRNQAKRLHMTKPAPQPSLIRADSDSLDLNPLTVKFENSYLEERNDNDFDERGNDIYCIPSNTPESHFSQDRPSINCSMCARERHSSTNNYGNGLSPNRNEIRQISLPLLGSNDLLNSRNNNLANYKEYCYGTSAIKHNTHTVDNSNSNGNRSFNKDNKVTPKRRKKVRINVHVPCIVQTSATPDSSSDSGDNGEHSTSGSRRFRTLVKTWIQNDIRAKEVTNLLEDVKDLNQRSRELSTKYSLT